MDELEKNTPDDFWRKAFDEAAETPPTRVWDTIERRLDESNGPRIMPLWGLGLTSSRPVLWGTGIAAALALLLVGWWVVNTQSTDQSVARIQPSSPVENRATVPLTPTNSSVDKSTGPSNEAVASVSKPSERSRQSSAVSDSQSLTQSAKKLEKEFAAQAIARLAQPESLLHRQTTATTAQRASSMTTKTGVPASAVGQMAVTSFTAGRNTATTDITPTEPKTLAFGPLAGKPLRLRSAGPIQRIVWFQAAGLPMKPELAKEKRKPRDRWASASVMPGAFNPMVSVQSVQSAFNNALLAYSSSTNQSGISSRANFSVAYQAGAGVQLTERLSVESGIGYLSGRSTVEAPQSVAQSSTNNFIQNTSFTRNSTISNLYVDALRNTSANKKANSVSQSSMDKSAAYTSYIAPGNYTNQARQTLSNHYQYVQVPVQVGYQLRPRKRLSLAVLGGLITNIFVRNTVGSDVVVTAKDGVYRPVSLAATVGGRFRYRPSGRWSASLAGLYQPSLESGTQADSPVQSRPTSTGMSFGVDYHF